MHALDCLNKGGFLVPTTTRTYVASSKKKNKHGRILELARHSDRNHRFFKKPPLKF